MIRVNVGIGIYDKGKKIQNFAVPYESPYKKKKKKNTKKLGKNTKFPQNTNINAFLSISGNFQNGKNKMVGGGRPTLLQIF